MWVSWVMARQVFVWLELTLFLLSALSLD